MYWPQENISVPIILLRRGMKLYDCVQVSLSISCYPLMGYNCTVVLCNAGSDPRNTDHIHLWRWKAILILQKMEKLHLLPETKISLKPKNLYTVLSIFIIKLAGGVKILYFSPKFSIFYVIFFGSESCYRCLFNCSVDFCVRVINC